MKKRILIVGYGGSGRRAHRIVRDIIPNAEIAIWHTGHRTIEDFTDAKPVSCVEEALAFQPEIVYIATPTSTHLSYAQLFLNFVEVILIDKPLDSTLNVCEVFCRNAKYSSTSVFLNFQRRYMDCWNWLYHAVRSYDTGGFLYAEGTIASNYTAWRPEKSPEVLYAARAELGGGVLLTECHEIDLIQWILGPITSVCASSFHDSEKYEVENQAQLLCEIEFPYGKRSVTLSMNDKADILHRRMNLYFDNLTFELDEEANSITICYSNGTSEKLSFLENTDAHEMLFRDLLAAPLHSKKLPTMNDGLCVNAVIHAAKNSISTGTWTQVCTTICPSEGASYLERALELLKEHFNDRLIAVYGLGSLGYGGFVSGWSDFDIDVIIKSDDLCARTDYQIGKKIEKQIQGEGFRRIDIRVYDYRHLNSRTTILEYGQCSRATMLCDSAVLLMGTDIRDRIVRPTIQELNREANSLLKHMLSFETTWWDCLPWDDIAAHFALIARFLYTKDTGKVVGKKAALEYFLKIYSDWVTDEQLQWMIWALSLREYHQPLVFQQRLHSSAVGNLKELFLKVLDVLEKEENS